MGKFGIFLGWVISTGLVGIGSAVLVVRANNTALPGSTVAKILKKGV